MQHHALDWLSEAENYFCGYRKSMNAADMPTVFRKGDKPIMLGRVLFYNKFNDIMSLKICLKTKC